MDDHGEPATGADEADRLRALYDMGILDSEPDPRFDRIVRTAAAVFRCPRAAIVLIDADRLWFKAQVGLPINEHPRAGTLGERMLRRREQVVCGDLHADPVFGPLVKELPAVDARFYACAPLFTRKGEMIGLLALGDPEPHPPATPEMEAALADLADLAMEEFNRDVETAATAARHRLDEQRVHLALQAARMGEYEWDLAKDQVILSDRTAALLDYPSGLMAAEQGERLRGMVHPDDQDLVTRAIQHAIDETGVYEVEYRHVREPGSRPSWRYTAGVVLYGTGHVAERVIGVTQDIDDRKREEERLQALLAELDHRVKNVLAAVQSLAVQSARRSGSLDSFLKTFQGRLKSMASAHDLLTATRWRGAMLSDIVGAELGGLAPLQTRWDGPELFLTPRAASALSLALHELAINAVKYGALSVEMGRVDVAWRISSSGGFILDWIESGGPRVSAPASERGFGATLLSDVAGRELGGQVEIDYRPSGVAARIEASAHAIGERRSSDEAFEAEHVADQIAAEFSPSGPTSSNRTDVKGLRLLIVEDSVLLAMELEAGLTELGAKVAGVAATLDEAMGMTSLPLDAAVLDANLDGLSVAPAAEALRARGVPFVFATGYADRAAPMGFDAPIIRKPYNVGQIAAALAQVAKPA
ncbi:HWE histidine kinase domain-containing protein [Caulobacter segnis]|uniref:HWE histidine kinase domain-containing protein n=1 Tax=Caulobacter segnis TaxID=88688 RepID=UPI0024105F15|nr:HWE histidine kinase domain-containing protein [Caulobacter segnis]MDG2521613.1 HWE histidine kinase domain-containing protein [Caulobacter segnis]